MTIPDHYYKINDKYWFKTLEKKLFKLVQLSNLSIQLSFLNRIILTYMLDFNAFSNFLVITLYLGDLQ